MTSTKSRNPWPWVAIVSRFAFFALAQVLIVLVIVALGGTSAWQSSAAWWMLSATAANVASFLLLRRRFAREGDSCRYLWRFSRQTFWKDLALAVGGFVLAGPVAMLPMRWLDDAVVGSYDSAIAVMFRPRLVPFLMIGHTLIDIGTWAVYFPLESPPAQFLSARSALPRRTSSVMNRRKASGSSNIGL